MRCKNCGWPNKPDVKNCVKCGEPLTEDNYAFQGGGTMPLTDNVPPVSSGLKKTVMEAGGFAPAPQTTPDRTVPMDQMGGGRQCAKCGYPLRDDAVKCPNCNTPVLAATVPGNNVHSMPEAPVTHHQSPKHRPTTINPYLMDMDPTPMCSLKPERWKVPSWVP